MLYSSTGLPLSPSPHAPEASDAPDAHLNGHCQYLTELDIRSDDIAQV